MSHTTSLVHIGHLQRSAADVTVAPFSLSVEFTGTLPPNLTSSCIPVEITLSVPERYAPFARPVLKIEGASETESGREDHQAHMIPNTLSSEIPITFLPLPTTFNSLKQDCWKELAFDIQAWLIMPAVRACGPYRTWGIEAFWIAFVAAYPEFPLGSWPSWNPKVPFEGAFLTARMLDMEVTENDADADGAKLGSQQDQSVAREEWEGRERRQLWTEFEQLATLFFPLPLIAQPAAYAL